MSSAELRAIHSCIAGDLSAFDVLYTTYIDSIFGFVYRRTLHRTTAEDLTSAVFTKAMEKIDTFKSDRGAFRTWLFAIARNVLTDHFRSHKFSEDIESIWDLESDDHPDIDAEQSIDMDRIREALQKIPSEKREIVLLRLWEGLSYKEISAVTGKSENNCKVIFCRTLDELRTTLSPSALALLLLFPLLR